MNYKCPLPPSLVPNASRFEEFAQGGAQATVRLTDGRVFESALISNGSAVVAVRGYKHPPFTSHDIAEVFQNAADKNPQNRSGWEYWDDWHTAPIA